jgi:molecular chaperone GrpE
MGGWVASPETMSTGTDAGMCAEQGSPHTTPTLELLRRERSDFVNYKRRVELERSADREQTRAAMMHALLPLLDELDRAFDHLPPALSPDPWVQGVALSRRRLEEALRGWGMERVAAVGERLDPTLHEAVAYEERSSLDEPVIAAVEQSGYRLGPRLIRTARVAVFGPSQSG